MLMDMPLEISDVLVILLLILDLLLLLLLDGGLAVVAPLLLPLVLRGLGTE